MSSEGAMFCRLCLHEGTLLPLDESEMKLKIMCCANIVITEDFKFQNYICVKCIGKMHIAYDFKKQCEESDSKLKKFLQLKYENGVPFTYEDMKCFFEMDLEEINNVNNVSPDAANSNVKGISSAIALKLRYNISKGVCEIDDSGNVNSNTAKTPNFDCESSNDYKFIIKNEMDINDNDNADCDSSEKRTDAKNSNTVKEHTDEPAKPKEKKRRGRRSNEILYDNFGRKISSMCEHCGKSFTKKETLRGHIRRHTGEKPYVCSDCGKSFHVANELRKHTMVHTGLKPYQCSYCVKKFSDWGSRNKHERIHKGEKPYMCDVCPKKFAYSYVLSRHKLTHSGEKEHMCTICQKRFALKSHLDNHIKRHLKCDKNDVITTSEPGNEIVVCDVNEMGLKI